MSKKSRAKAATWAKAPTASRPLSPREPSAFLARWGTLFASGIVVLAALAAYHNSFSGPFILDDRLAIADNPSIRHFWSALSPPPDASTGGRPLLNLTFALNYALGRMDVWGYHVFNLLIHTLAGLTLFGLVRRTLASRLATRGFQISNLKSKTVEGPATAQSEILNLRFEMPEATLLALAVAVIWTVHPLQTEAVTYISQRAESLMGLFYLLTLYCFVRFTDETGERQQARGERSEHGSPPNSAVQSFSSSVLSWRLASIFFCFLGATTKEIIVTAPVMVLLYDRTFVAGSFREAWRQRWRYYLGLAATWLLLARLMTGLTQRGVGFGDTVNWWNYALTSCRSVGLYLKLAIWPHPLVFDYGTNTIVVQHAAEIAPYALLLAVLLAGTAIALWRWPVVGFAGVWLFLILAPTSSVVPVILSPMAEHRMYLPLASVVAFVVLGLYRLMGRRSLILFAAIAVGLGWLSVRRNEDYRSEVAMLSDTAAKCPDNERVRYNYGLALSHIAGRERDAIAEYQAALRIDPDYVDAHNNLGNALSQIPGRLPDAMAEYQAALRINPNSAEAHNNLGNALSQIPGRLPDAMAEYQAALRINPDYADAHYDFGKALSQIPGRLPDAMAEYQAALRINPDYAAAHNNLGNALLQIPGRLPEAMAEYQAALRIDPDYADAHYNLGVSLSQIPGRSPDAMAEYQAVLRINPDDADAHYNLGRLLIDIPGRRQDAIFHFEAALRIRPDFVQARETLNQLQKSEQ
jgi:tetratricopeptide (TPR) repeat protein